MEDKIKIAGAEVIVQVIDKKTGKVVEERRKHNLILNNMRIHIRNRLIGSYQGYYSGIWSYPNIHIGTNGTAPDPTQTSLTEQYRE